MAKQKKPFSYREVRITPVKTHTLKDGTDKIAYRINWPKRLLIAGTPATTTVRTISKAKVIIDRRIIKKDNLGALASLVGPAKTEDAAEAIEILKPIGLTLKEAAQFALKHFSPKQGIHTVSEVIEACLKAKAEGRAYKSGRVAKKVSKRYLGDFRNRLNQFASVNGDKLMRDVTKDDVESFIFSSNNWSDQNKLNHFRGLHTFFQFASREGYKEGNPMSDMRMPHPKKRMAEILTIPQCRKLLEVAYEKIELDLLAYVVLGLFAGIRPAELERLEWKRVNLKKKLVWIEDTHSKTRDHRNAELPNNAIEWLMLCPRKEGSIVPEGFDRRWRTIKKLSGIQPWPHDAMRHTAASYFYAKTGDSKATSLSMGHTEKVLFDHYRRLVDDDDVLEFYSLRPEIEQAKITALVRA